MQLWPFQLLFFQLQAAAAQLEGERHTPGLLLVPVWSEVTCCGGHTACAVSQGLVPALFCTAVVS